MPAGRELEPLIRGAHLVPDIGQLETLYDRLQPPEKLLRLVKLEIEAIASRREEIARRELTGIKRTLATVEGKEMKLVDELVSSRVSRDLYEKLSKRYLGERRAAEARLAQLEVDYGDPLDFLDKCLVVASTFRYLHEQFTEPQQKMLLRALFQRIDVRQRAIVGATLNPPFSFFMGEAVSKAFKDPPSEGTWKEVFEQLVRYTLSPEYDTMKDLIGSILEEEQEKVKTNKLAA